MKTVEQIGAEINAVLAAEANLPLRFVYPPNADRAKFDALIGRLATGQIDGATALLEHGEMLKQGTST